MKQKQRILEFLNAGHTLTRLNAWHELGVLEAPARISELRQEGHPITTKMVAVTNRYGEKVHIAHWRIEHGTSLHGS